MKYDIKKIYIFAFLILTIISFGVFFKIQNSQIEKKINQAKHVLIDLVSNKEKINFMVEVLNLSKRRIEEGRNRNINTEIESIAEQVSAKKNLKKINFLTRKKEGAYNKEEYEIKIEGIDINTFVNFLHKIKTANLYLKISSFNITTSFENPAVLNASIVITYIN